MADDGSQEDEQARRLWNAVTRLDSKVRHMEENEERILSCMKKRRILFLAVLAVGALSAIIAIENNHILQENRAGPSPGPDYAVIDTGGGMIQSWAAWNIPRNHDLTFFVVKSPEVTAGRLAVIHDVVFSNRTVPSKGTLYYKGWEGAIMAVSNRNTRLEIPHDFSMQESGTGAGDIVIKLTDSVNPAGYTGFTKSIADPVDHQILRSEIVIYGAGSLDDNQFAAILRHEIGHALGLAYSDDPNDIMHLTISQPYISSCDISALASLYNGSGKSQVSC